MNQPSKIEKFWQSYLSTLSEVDQKNTSTYVVDQFADTPEAATKVGNIELIVDGNGEPLCIIELIEVEIKPFNAVDEQFAFEYGEGDRTLAFWLGDNWDFLSRWCIEIGRKPSETMPIVFQRLRVLYPKNNT